MLIFEENQQDKTLGELNSSLLEVESRTMHDLEVIKNIQEAESKIHGEGATYGNFDMGLSEEEIALLNELQISEAGTTSHFGELKDLTNTAKEFIQSISIAGLEEHKAMHIAKVITRLAHNVIDSSTYEDAFISIRADIQASEIDQYEKFPDWHIDKNFEEIVHSSKNISTSKDKYFYLLTLKGNSTLYYPTDTNSRESFLRETHSLGVTYGYDYKHESNMQDLPLSNSSSVSYGQGCLHIIGKDYGAIHSAPKHHERLVIVITPEYSETIAEYKKAIEEISRKAIQELLDEEEGL